ncbi:MAG: enoyl-CoA hydratase/isomerase family protein [Chlamydiia bacterium]|nr:enoyl-CoA hydratase/isomerase family protein [Chlamydiia bacterium]
MNLLLSERIDDTLLLTLNRPDKLNALNQALLQELEQALDDAESLRALVLTGVGEKAFCAGADIKAMRSMQSGEIEEFIRLGLRVAEKIEKAPFPTIAAVRGFALGGGLEMALACDFIYANQTAKLGLPEASLGLIPGFGGVRRLTDAVGKRRAKELMMTAKPLSAEEAKACGLVNRIEGDPVQAALATAKECAAFSPLALAKLKGVVEGAVDPIKAFVECHRYL